LTHGLHPSPRFLDRCCRSIRADRPVSPKGQQHYPAGVPRPAFDQGKKALISFGKPGWQRRLEQAIKQWWFELTLPAKLDQAEADWHTAQPPEPEPAIVHHKIDDRLQTGESRKLGGAMSIHAPWIDDAKQNSST
jgi:hypothetical protein